VEGFHRHTAGDCGNAWQACQPIGVEVLVGRQVRDLDLEDVVVVAGHVVRVPHFGQFDDGAFERDHVGAGVTHDPHADQDALLSFAAPPTRRSGDIEEA